MPHGCAQVAAQFPGIGHRRLAGEPRADECRSFFFLDYGQVGNGFRQGRRKILRNGFVRGQLEHCFPEGERGNCHCVQFIRLRIFANDHHLHVRLRQMHRGNAIGRGEDSVLFRQSCQNFNRLLGLIAIPLMVGVTVKPQQGDRSHGIPGGSG